MDRIGQFTALERWLHSGTQRQEAGSEAGPDRRQGSSRLVGENFGGGLVGNSQEEDKEGIAGGGEEPACLGKEGTLSQERIVEGSQSTTQDNGH